MTFFEILLVAASTFTVQELTAWFVAISSGLGLITAALIKLVSVAKQLAPLAEQLRVKLGLDDDGDDGIHALVKESLAKQDVILRRLDEHGERLNKLEDSKRTPVLHAISVGKGGQQ